MSLCCLKSRNTCLVMVLFSLLITALVSQRGHLQERQSQEVSSQQETAQQDTTQPQAANQSDESPAKTETLREAWYGELNMGAIKPVMQFRIVKLPDGNTKAYFDSITEGATGFDATWKIEDGEITFFVEKIRLEYVGQLNEAGDESNGTWKQGGREFPLKLRKHDSAYDNSNVWENRPQRPRPKFPYDALEVKIPNSIDDLVLAGTLTIPKKAGRHPAVILISGSGPQDRDESLMEHKPFLVLADYLSRRGIAVLRYDDRGFGESTGKFSTATTEDFATDAAAAVEFLKSHERINPDQIGLAGHSEGGLIAPITAGMRDDVAFMVLMAATGVDGKSILISQSKVLLDASGVPQEMGQVELAVTEAAIDAAVKAENEQEFDQIMEGKLNSILETLPEDSRESTGELLRWGLANQKPNLLSDWMKFFIAYDPKPALTRIQCPVLAIIGSKDLQVLPDLNMPEIRKALEQGSTEDFELIEIEGLNHLFQACETGSITEYATIQETFNPQALKAIGDWIVDRTTPVE